ncbi:MAG: type IV pilus biogenesis/stability protein PilW [Burkholderiaceae bacterium]|nr:type IV pilus biogenesis/stability protein PilW [Rhodoferax sp.]MCP5287425.1 type IV pilus biogenesis/stability protein PilW [Burkholderiaceae bacterium]
MGRTVACLLLITAGLLSACTTPTAGTDLRTASDMTEADRRARLRLELASGYFSRGQPETALDEVKQAIAARPDIAEAYALRGLIYASLNKPALADESFQRALQLEPANADTLHNYGWYLCQLQRWDEAFARFDAAIAQPQYRDAARSLLAKGLCEARAGRVAAAERTLTRSYEMDPTNPGTAFNLAEVLFGLGELERARFYLRRLNEQPATSNAQTLWLAARVEHRLGNIVGARTLGDELRRRFPQSAEALRFEQGRFDG